MNIKLSKQYLVWIAFSEGVGILSGLLSRAGMLDYSMTAAKPELTPPTILFPIIWTILYALMGIGAARISASPPSAEKGLGLNLFITQLIVNFFWSLIFFNARAYGFALLWLLILWVLVFTMIVEFGKVDRPAALLQIPYLLWLTFAAYLNYAAWQLNR